MKILSIYRSRLGESRGTPIRVRSIIAELCRSPDLTIITASWDVACSFSGDHKRHVFLDNRHVRDLLKLLRVIRQERIDVVVGHTMATWYYLLVIRVFTSAKIVLEMHGFIEEERILYASGGRHDIRYVVERYLYGIVYRNCHLITTCSKTAADILKRYNANTIAIFGGVDIELFNPQVAPGKFLSPQGLVVGYAGNSRVWQGLPFLIGVIEDLKRRYPAVELAILSSERKELPVIDGITFVGPVTHEEVPAFLQECDILVVPRPDTVVNRISFPSKLIEYMAMGKPVVASATSDAHRVIESGIDGLIYEPGDREGFMCAIGLLQDPRDRVVMGAAARKKVESDFTWSQQTEILERAMRALLS